MNGANSDNAVSIQKMVTLNMQHCSDTSIQLGPGRYCTHKDKFIPVFRGSQAPFYMDRIPTCVQSRAQ